MPASNEHITEKHQQELKKTENPPNVAPDPPDRSNHVATQGDGPTAFQFSIAAIMLATSAGFVMYPKRASSMLRTINEMNENALRRRPPKIGPPTKQEWEKLRPRFDKDEFF